MHAQRLRSALSIYAPDGSSVTNNQSGTQSSASLATDGNLGTYTVVDIASLYCSCARCEVEAGGGTPVPVTATLQLTVNQTSCTVPRQNGTCQFVVGAQANGGWNGTVSGTISVSGAGNPNSVLLSAGTAGINPSFTLSALGATQGTCSPPSAFCFTMTSDPNNQNAGTVIYSVILNNSTDSPPTYTVPTSSCCKQVTVTVQ